MRGVVRGDVLGDVLGDAIGGPRGEGDQSAVGEAAVEDRAEPAGCVCARARVCVRACIRVRVRACVRVCVTVCLRVSVRRLCVLGAAAGVAAVPQDSFVTCQFIASGFASISGLNELFHARDEFIRASPHPPSAFDQSSSSCRVASRKTTASVPSSCKRGSSRICMVAGVVTPSCVDKVLSTMTA